MDVAARPPYGHTGLVSHAARFISLRTLSAASRVSASTWSLDLYAAQAAVFLRSSTAVLTHTGARRGGACIPDARASRHRLSPAIITALYCAAVSVVGSFGPSAADRILHEPVFSLEFWTRRV
eukprot:3818547-Pleurochrysis_carterae.AAC.3